jgi:hypothetical protein
MARERKQIDWERVEIEYRAGKLSLREIAKASGCSEGAIRKRAKTDGWERDLSKRIEEEVRNKLVRSEVRKAERVPEKEIIEAVATRSANIVLAERKDLEELRALENKLMAELDGTPTKLFIAQYQGGIVEKVVELTVTEKAATLSSLAGVRAKRIELERKVWGVVDPGEPPPEPGGNERLPVTLPDHILAMIPIMSMQDQS